MLCPSTTPFTDAEIATVLGVGRDTVTHIKAAGVMDHGARIQTWSGYVDCPNAYDVLAGAVFFMMKRNIPNVTARSHFLAPCLIVADGEIENDFSTHTASLIHKLSLELVLFEPWIEVAPGTLDYFENAVHFASTKAVHILRTTFFRMQAVASMPGKELSSFEFQYSDERQNLIKVANERPVRPTSLISNPSDARGFAEKPTEDSLWSSATKNSLQNED